MSQGSRSSGRGGRGGSASTRLLRASTRRATEYSGLLDRHATCCFFCRFTWHSVAEQARCRSPTRGCGRNHFRQKRQGRGENEDIPTTHHRFLKSQFADEHRGRRQLGQRGPTGAVGARLSRASRATPRRAEPDRANACVGGSVLESRRGSIHASVKAPAPSFGWAATSPLQAAEPAAPASSAALRASSAAASLLMTGTYSFEAQHHDLRGRRICGC